MMRMDATARQGGFRVTGWLVFWSLAGFFGIVTLANVVMMWFALSTFTGIEAPNAYEAGRGFNDSLARAAAQAAAGWSAQAEIDGSGRRIAVRLRDGAGAPVAGLAVTAIFRNPVTAARDAESALEEREAGMYGAAMPPLVTGQWDLVIEARDGQGVVYASANRIVLR